MPIKLYVNKILYRVYYVIVMFIVITVFYLWNFSLLDSNISLFPVVVACSVLGAREKYV